MGDTEKITTRSEAMIDVPTCSACKGPTPWIEEDPHAHDANGTFCEECGHFYGIPAFRSRGPRAFSSLLAEYCHYQLWDWVMARLQYVPEEGTFVDAYGCTVLKCAIDRQAPVWILRAMLATHPEGLAVPGWYGGISAAITDRPMEEKLVETCKFLLSDNTDILLDLPYPRGFSKPTTPLGKCSDDYAMHFLKASKNVLPPKKVMYTYTHRNEDDHIKVKKGGLRHAFDLCSMMVKASYYGKLDGDILTSKPVLHGIAGCRDPFLVGEEGFTALAIKMFPEELVQKDTRGNSPLHIAAATINRDIKEYVDGYPYQPDDDEEALIQAKAIFMESFCKHGCPAGGFGDFGEEYCECDLVYGDMFDYEGCTCEYQNWEEGHRKDEEIKACQSCLAAYHAQIKDRATSHCNCHEEGLRAKKEKMEQCNCENAFEYYHTKMTKEHRLDKKTVIEVLVKACPESASFRNNDGQLPIHLAVAKGMKCWEGGVQSIAKANPEGVGMKDPQNHLYPFMAAATMDDLDTAFELLRFKLEVVAWQMSGRDTSNDETKKAMNVSSGCKRKLPQE